MESSPLDADLVEHFAEEVIDMCHTSEQACTQQPPGVSSSLRSNLWAILEELKQNLPRRSPHPDLSWFHGEWEPSLLDPSIQNGQWQEDQPNVSDLGGMDRGLASFLQLEGLTDT